MIGKSINTVFLTGMLACVVLTGLSLWTTEAMEAKTPSSSLSNQPVEDSLDTLQDRMVEVGTWVFDHNGLRGEVDRGSVTWTFADNGTMTIADSDENRTVSYSLTKNCGGYGEIGGGNKAYLKVESGGGDVDCYIIGHLVEVGPPERKVLALDNDRGNSLYLIPAN
jgi:hypothetical protein